MFFSVGEQRKMSPKDFYDDSWLRLCQRLNEMPFASQLMSLSRNFGSFAAIRAGLIVVKAPFIAVMAADLQEPPELIHGLIAQLQSGQIDIALGQRIGREDAWSTRILSNLFWDCFRKFIQPEIPKGGVDIFACTRSVSNHLTSLPENISSLIGLLFWIGYRRGFVPYERKVRQIGVSSWSLRKKVKYLNDSIFSFSDLPIQLLLRIGFAGLAISIILSIINI